MRRVLLWLIRVYQQKISANTAPRCRFYPTCSNYTYTAIERFGVFRGTFMGMWRILRCNPFNPGGYDAVPEKVEKSKKPEKLEKKIKIKAQPLSSKNNIGDFHD